MNFKCYADGKEVSDQELLGALNQNEIPVFESLRVYGGTVFRFEEHLKRMNESARACGVNLPAVSDQRKSIALALKTSQAADGFIRITFKAGQLIVMIGTRKHNPAIYQEGINLKTSSFRMPSPKESDAQSKTGNYRLQILETAGQNNAYEYLFLDGNHFLTEARVGNFFMVKNGAVLTPPAASVLNGITREVVIECARESGILTQETPLTRHDAFNADEAFLTNTSWEILPVRSLDARLVKKVCGPVTQKLIQIFKRKVERECHLQKKVLQIRKSAAHSSPFPISKA